MLLQLDSGMFYEFVAEDLANENPKRITLKRQRLYIHVMIISSNSRLGLVIL